MNANPALLAELRARGELWAATEQAAPRALEASSGALGGLLPGGWPRGALIEVLSGGPGFGEVSFFMELAARLTRAGREVAWVAPRGLPGAPALAAAGLDLRHFLWVRAAGRGEAGWAARELLASGAVPLVLLGREPGDERALRALALAAREGDALGVLLRDSSRRGCASPARWRLELLPGPRGGRRLVVVKGPGVTPGTTVTFPA